MRSRIVPSSIHNAALIDALIVLLLSTTLRLKNIQRTDLTPAERAVHIAERKRIYLLKKPDTQHGGDRRSSRQPGDLKDESFVADTVKNTGQSERKVQRDAYRGAEIGTDALSKVVGTSLDKGEELDALAPDT